jgi:hypothetical protein
MSGGRLRWRTGRRSLIAVDLHRSPRPNAAPGTSFSLLLRGAAAPIVPEGLHRLAFEDGESFELYLIPIHTPSRDHQDYQVVFN